MRIVWFSEAWADYLYWQNKDRQVLRRVNDLIKDISRNGYEGIGKPEPLKGEFSGFWSRRIDHVNRLVYRISGKDVRTLEVLSCRGHYQ